MARRELTEDEVRRIVAAERDDYLAAGRAAQAAVLGRYVSLPRSAETWPTAGRDRLTSLCR
jgi:hypothetical protein